MLRKIPSLILQILTAINNMAGIVLGAGLVLCGPITIDNFFVEYLLHTRHLSKHYSQRV